jgi:hypothetical protein
MKRRQFLTLGGAGAGACFFTDALWRRFADYADNQGASLPQGIPKSVVETLYVESECGMIALNSRPWDTWAPRLTWSEYLEKTLGYVPDCSEGWRDAHDRFNLLPPPGSCRFRNELSKKGGCHYEVDDLDDSIPDGLQSNYEQWGWVIRDSPESQAFHFLDGLDIGNLDSDSTALSIGKLDFCEGPAPGNNSTSVTLEGGRPEVAASCLQRRLNELVGNVEVIYG